MKKIGLWKKLASWLLVFLLVLQIPVNVFAEEWISGTDISADNDFAEEENSGYIEEEENIDFIDDEKIEETENDSFTDSENLSEEETTLFNDGTNPEESSEEAQEVQVTVSVSKDGKFLNDKNGNPMAGRSITLTGKNIYNMDDALKLAHDLYYPGGSEAGYESGRRPFRQAHGERDQRCRRADGQCGEGFPRHHRLQERLQRLCGQRKRNRPHAGRKRRQ